MLQSHYADALRLWMCGTGVPHHVAGRAASKIASKLDAGGRLEEEELQLIVAYLERPGSNPALDRGLAAIIEKQKMFPSQPKPTQPSPVPTPYPIVVLPPKNGAKGRVPSHTPEWQNPTTGDPGRTAQQHNQSDLQFIRSLASRVGS